MPETHVIDVRPDGWTIQHPLACRSMLFACPVNRAAERQLAGPPADPGRYVCDLAEGGRLLIGRPATDEDLDAGVLAELLAEWQARQPTGPLSYPNSTGGEIFAANLQRVQDRCVGLLAANTVTWPDLLGLAVAQAMAESDPAWLRTHLIEVGGTVIDWIKDIDRRAAAGTTS